MEAMYKGYYIDNVFFHNAEEIDQHIKEQLIGQYKMLNQLFLTVDRNLETALACNEIAEKLTTEYGMSWDELVQMEADTYEENHSIF